MAEPWFANPDMFGGLYGGIVGGGGGTLIGLLGAFAGYFAPRGKYRGLVVGGMSLFCGLGVVQLLVGITALVTGQPYAIWFPLVLAGTIFALVCGGLIPQLRRQYGLAEQRKMEAEDLRRS